jgi:hypothetical protein
MKKPSWNDLFNATPQDLKRTYKLNDCQLEHAVRRHMDGASPEERRDLYGKVWNSKTKS